jgi:Sulfatase
MGDDIGIWNIGAYHRGLLAGRTPNLGKLAKEGTLFTNYYAEASCTAGRANFITGELPIRTGMTKVGQAGAKIVFVQQVMGKEIQTFLEYPPMQRGASFNLDAIKAEMAKRGSAQRSQQLTGASFTEGGSQGPP